MNGTMWVESELGKGSKFFFTITSQISQSSIESVLSKMQPFAKRTILFVDTLDDRTGVVMRITELGLQPHVVSDVSKVADKEHCPHIDTILVDSLMVVSNSFNAHSIQNIKSYSYTFRMIRRNKFESMSTCDIYRLFCSRRCVLTLMRASLFFRFMSCIFHLIVNTQIKLYVVPPFPLLSFLHFLNFFF